MAQGFGHHPGISRRSTMPAGFPWQEARLKLVKGQLPVLDALVELARLD